MKGSLVGVIYLPWDSRSSWYLAVSMSGMRWPFVVLGSAFGVVWFNGFFEPQSIQGNKHTKDCELIRCADAQFPVVFSCLSECSAC